MLPSSERYDEPLMNVQVPSSSLITSNIIPQLLVIPADIRDTFAFSLLAFLKYVKGSQETRDAADSSYAEFQGLAQVYVYVHPPRCSHMKSCDLVPSRRTDLPFSEANRLYSTSSPNTSFAYPFLNPLILNLARSLVRISNRVSNRYRLTYVILNSGAGCITLASSSAITSLSPLYP